jgi:hypothetical protein
MRPKCDWTVEISLDEKAIVCGKPSIGEIPQYSFVGTPYHHHDGICQEHLGEYLEQLFYPYNSNGQALLKIIERASNEVKDMFLV